MPRIPIFRLGSAVELERPRLAGYKPSLVLEHLQLGVDNLRHDVHLSPRFVELARLHIARLVARFGDVEGLLAAEAPESGRRSHFLAPGSLPKLRARTEPADLKPLLAAIESAGLNRAKAEGNVSVDLLARVAVLKFLRVELQAQFAQLLERCRMTLKSYEGLRQQKALEYRERVAAFQVAKKIILRKTGQELFRTLREIEKETLGKTRRSLFGNQWEELYSLFLNPLIFTEDGRDAYLNAEHYVMFGNFDRDPDRFDNVSELAREFLESVALEAGTDEATLDGWLSVPENAQELIGGGAADESTGAGRSQKARLAAWTEMLEQARVIEYVVASYEVVPLLSEYSPRINAQQLKNALVSREERDRVEKLIADHGRLTPDSLYAAAARVAGCRAAERTRIAARFLRDLMRYHRDWRRLEALNGAMDSVNLIGNAKLRDLSAMNGTLYEFLLAEEQKPTEDKVVRHVVIKADVRDSSRLTRSLMEKGMNPASYFSLNFYDPVNKLLAKYSASKVFIEGDAVILALLEREGEPGLAVGRACVLAREMLEIVNGYNQMVERAGLPGLELGVGISFQDCAPLYLMDGAQRIMISEALNESDRLSSCSKRLRKAMEAKKVPFRVYVMHTDNETDAAEGGEDFVMSYNLNGIRISEAAFHRLRQEISLETCRLGCPRLFGSEEYLLYSGMVPVGGDIFRRIVIRASRMPQVDPRDFNLQRWTERNYYEVCSNPAVYAALEKKSAAGR